MSAYGASQGIRRRNIYSTKILRQGTVENGSGIEVNGEEDCI